MKTLKALRTAIESNGDKLQIGKLVLNGKRGSDIDIHLDHNLIGWIYASQPDETKLEDATMTINDAVFVSESSRKAAEELAKSFEEKESLLTQAHAKIGELEAELEEAQSKPAIKDGMIFAYEKVLKINHDQPGEEKDNESV